MVRPDATRREVGMRAASFAVAMSITEIDLSRLLVPTRYFPSCVTARLYTPFPVGKRRVIVQLATSISTISLLLLQATKIRAPSADGWTHVGEQLTSPALGISMP